MPRRRCRSADETVLFPRHNTSDCHIAPPTEAVSESQSPERHHTHPSVAPAQPLHRPPERIQTPTGLPRWPGEIDHDQETVQQLTVRTSRRDLLREYLRRPPSRPKLKEVLRGERTATLDKAVRTGTRFWRPPTSGHNTRRYDELASHPFSFVPIAESSGISPALDCRPTTEDQGVTCSPVKSEQRVPNSPTSDIGESLRALRSASLNAVPVSMRRASAQAGNRSAAIPARIRTSFNVEASPVQMSQNSDIDPSRTMDMLDRFPPPPAVAQGRQQSHSQKRSSWSLYPAVCRVEGADQQQSRPLRRKTPTSYEESEGSNNAIRGESQARYRLSGTPIYDTDRNSLTTLDRDREMVTECGALDTDAALIEPLRRSEVQRAISNGATRFSTRLDAPLPAIPTRSTPQHDVENQGPSGTYLHQPTQLCKHKLAKLRTYEKKHPSLVSISHYATQLDGASTPTPQSPTSARDHALTTPSISTQARAAVSPAVHIDRPSTRTTFVTAPNGATTFTISPTTVPTERSPEFAGLPTSSTMPGRA